MHYWQNAELAAAYGYSLYGQSGRRWRRNVRNGLLGPPVLDSIEPTTAVLGGEDLVLHVYGSNFIEGDSVIMFNGGAEETTWVSENELTTIVKPSTATIIGEFPVAVQNPGGVLSEPQMFTFTEVVTPGGGGSG